MICSSENFASIGKLLSKFLRSPHIIVSIYDTNDTNFQFVEIL